MKKPLPFKEKKRLIFSQQVSSFPGTESYRVSYECFYILILSFFSYASFYGSASGKIRVVGSGTISLVERRYVGLAETEDLALHDVNGIQMEILMRLPMGRNADRDASC